MEMKYNKTKIYIFIIVNLIILTTLYNVPIESKMLENLCLIKILTKKECWNCGMTRAFLSVIHFRFDLAYSYNSKVIVVFPLTILIYLFSWYKYMTFEGGIKK